eukprot:3076470-Rhodomonas_salina.1
MLDCIPRAQGDSTIRYPSTAYSVRGTIRYIRTDHETPYAIAVPDMGYGVRSREVRYETPYAIAVLDMRYGVRREIGHTWSRTE